MMGEDHVDLALRIGELVDGSGAPPMMAALPCRDRCWSEERREF
jgi:hypothetical protein